MPIFLGPPANVFVYVCVLIPANIPGWPPSLLKLVDSTHSLSTLMTITLAKNISKTKVLCELTDVFNFALAEVCQQCWQGLYARPGLEPSDVA